MKSKKLVIQINRPVKQVFDFVTDPANTPKWIDFISEEKTNEWPPRLGTVYQNREGSGEWRKLVITEFEQDKMFTMANREGGYNVRYTLKPVGDDATELEYFEWMDEGELDDPFTIEILEQLKSVMESE